MDSQVSPVAGLTAEQWDNVDRAFTCIAAAVRSARAREAGLRAAGKKRSDFTREEWDRVAADYEARGMA